MNDKLMAWSSKKFENNIIEKVFTTIFEKKVELHARVQNIEEIIHKIKNCIISYVMCQGLPMIFRQTYNISRLK